MTDDRTRRYKDDDPDELWDDDLRIASGSDVRNEWSRKDHDTQTPEEEYSGHETHNAGYDDDPDNGFDDRDMGDDDHSMDYEDVGRNFEEATSGEKAGPKPKRRKIFGIVDDDEGNDFFDNDSDPEAEPERKPEPKPVKLDPEDPDYWMDEEPDFNHILPKPKKVWMWWAAGVLLLIAVIAGLWVWFLTPYTDGAVKYGYLKSMERRGTFVKTFEGVLIPYRELGDSTPTYFEEVRFSVDGDSLAAHMKGMMLNCIPVRLEYERYHTPLFWKGAETMVIVGADTADVSKILPPDYR